MKICQFIRLTFGASVLFLTGCCMDDMSCGGSNTYVPVSTCNTCASGCQPKVATCRPACTTCGYDGSYAYTSWY
ncbi:MAG: hypothetical protein EBY16_07355 [Gammaproteobacteria bacterium]|nr:hypothetical protein [Gammaproteobacteria bacterium]